MSARVAELIADGAPVDLPGDNLLVDLDLSAGALPIGARVRVGSALLEVSPMPHTGCRKFAERFGQDALRWVNWKEHRDRRLRGVNCRVLEPGNVSVGDRCQVE
jgi:MOSC domain-containing protein YiiM